MREFEARTGAVLRGRYNLQLFMYQLRSATPVGVPVTLIYTLCAYQPWTLLAFLISPTLRALVPRWKLPWGLNLGSEVPNLGSEVRWKLGRSAIFCLDLRIASRNMSS